MRARRHPTLTALSIAGRLGAFAASTTDEAGFVNP
jgi:hypothetical protein